MSNDFDWVKDIGFLEFNGINEYYIDVSGLSFDDKMLIFDYLNKKSDNKIKTNFYGNDISVDVKDSRAFILHCGKDNFNYQPREFEFCFMIGTKEENELLDELTIIIDTEDLLDLIKRESLNENSDFDWVGDIELPLGVEFGEEDYSLEYDEIKEVNILGNEIVYHLTYERYSDLVCDLNDEWYAKYMIDGGYDWSYDEEYIDDDEINYIGRWVDNESLEQMSEVLKLYDIELNVKSLSDDHELLKLGDFIKEFVDWEDFKRDVSIELEYSYLKTGWEGTNDEFSKTLRDNNIKIDVNYGDYTENNIYTITLPYPYKDEINLSKILTKKLNDDICWDFRDVYFSHQSGELAGPIINKRFKELVDELMENYDNFSDDGDLNENTSDFEWIDDIVPTDDEEVEYFINLFNEEYPGKPIEYEDLGREDVDGFIAYYRISPLYSEDGDLWYEINYVEREYNSFLVEYHDGNGYSGDWMCDTIGDCMKIIIDNLKEDMEGGLF